MYLFAASSPLFSAYAQADFFGKLIFLALFAVSTICWIVLIHKILQVRRVKKLSYTLAKTCEKGQDHLLNLNLSTKRENHPFARVFFALKGKTLEILNKNQFYSEEKDHVYLTRSDIELLETHVLTTISEESKFLEKNLFILSMIVSLAPFLGLLGTVWGILVTFGEFQGGAGGLSNTAVLGGLSTALVTTVLGLLIAIPALVSSSWLRTNFNALTSDMEDFLYKLLSTLELQYRKPS